MASQARHELDSQYTTRASRARSREGEPFSAATQYETRRFSRKPGRRHSLSPRERVGVRGNKPANFTRTHRIASALFRSNFSERHTRIRVQVFLRWPVKL